MNALTRFGSLSLLAFGLAVGCTDDHPDLACTPGETNRCLGPDACLGAQICLADGSTYAECDCVVDGGGVIDGGDVIDGAAGSGDPDSSTGDADGGDAPVPQAEDSDCDMNGVWAVRKLTLPIDTVIGDVQPRSTWTYLEITQDGADFTVGKSVDCGLRASGHADVSFSLATMNGISDKNPQAGRTGTYVKNVDHCEFSIQRWYTRLGLAASHLPVQGSATALPADLEDLIGVAEDWDQDGYGGVAYITSGLISGKRHMISIDWDTYFHNEGYGHMPALGATDFTLRTEYDMAEALLFSEMNNGGESMSVIPSGQVSIPSSDNSVRFSLLGRTLAEAWAGEVVVQDDDLNTCSNIQAAFPHNEDQL